MLTLKYRVAKEHVVYTEEGSYARTNSFGRYAHQYKFNQKPTRRAFVSSFPFLSRCRCRCYVLFWKQRRVREREKKKKLTKKQIPTQRVTYMNNGTAGADFYVVLFESCFRIGTSIIWLERA